MPSTGYEQRKWKPKSEVFRYFFHHHSSHHSHLVACFCSGSCRGTSSFFSVLCLLLLHISISSDFPVLSRAGWYNEFKALWGHGTPCFSVWKNKDLSAYNISTGHICSYSILECKFPLVRVSSPPTQWKW